MMAAPLSYHGEATGAILISRLSDRPFSQSDFEVFIGLTQQAAVAIHNAQMVERIQDHAADLEGRVAERTAELAATNQHLEAMARVKDEFVSNVSHELRTPITSIKLYHSLLDRNPTRREHYMATLHRETERLQHIVEDLLNLSRLSKDAWPLSQEPVDLNQLARTYVDDRRSLADSRGLRLTIQEQPDLPPAGGEAGQLGQALGVLLTNALNYTPTGGEVRVSTRLGRQDDRTWLQLSVRDSGPGIGAEEQPQIFERFFRGSAARASGAAGTGLGLAIARQIVERHGGRIELSGPGLDGAGACFSIWLPAFQGEEG